MDEENKVVEEGDEKEVEAPVGGEETATPEVVEGDEEKKDADEDGVVKPEVGESPVL